MITNQDTMELVNVTANCRKKKCVLTKNSKECKLAFFTANCPCTEKEENKEKEQQK